MEETTNRQGDFIITCQHKLPKEERFELNGELKEVHVVIKQSSFIIILSNDKISLKDCTIDCTLVYDNDSTNEVHYINQKPISFTTQVTNQHRVTCDIKIGVLSSQHEDMLFKILFRVMNDQGKLIGQLYSYPIRVISKADSKKKTTTKPPKQPTSLKTETKQKVPVLAKRSSNEELSQNQLNELTPMNEINSSQNQNGNQLNNSVGNSVSNPNGNQLPNSSNGNQLQNSVSNQIPNLLGNTMSSSTGNQVSNPLSNSLSTGNQTGNGISMQQSQVNKSGNFEDQIKRENDIFQSQLHMSNGLPNSMGNQQMNGTFGTTQQEEQKDDSILSILQYQQSILRELTQQTNSNPLANPLLGMINAYKQLPQNQRIPQLLRIITTLTPQDNALISELVSFIIGINSSVQNDAQQMVQQYPQQTQQSNEYNQTQNYNQQTQFQHVQNQQNPSPNPQSFSPNHFYGGNNDGNFYPDNTMN